MSYSKLLTIIVPTFNRKECLELLLEELSRQLDGMADLVDVIIGDNASTDDTPSVTRRFLTLFPGALVIRHESNLGPEENFCRCLELSKSKYFWIIGDDDLPKSGVIAKIVNLLSRDAPDLVYLNSEWLDPLYSSRQGSPIGELRVSMNDRLKFAREVHVWFTFISGMIVSRAALRNALNEQTIRRFVGSQLVQLGWVFPVLSTGTRFLLVHDKCVLARKGNSGGYGLLTVFGTNFTRLARTSFPEQPEIANALIRGNLTRYLPGIIWNSRWQVDQRFSAEHPWPSMREQLGTRALFWALIVPLGRFPRLAALPFYEIWRVANRFVREFDRLFPKGHTIKEIDR